MWLLAQGDALATGAVLLACLWMALGLYSIGMWLENRSHAWRLECLRLAINLPAFWLAGELGMLTLDATAWAWLIGYSLVSMLGLWLVPRVGRTGTPAARSEANSPHIGA